MRYRLRLRLPPGAFRFRSCARCGALVTVITGNGEMNGEKDHAAFHEKLDEQLAWLEEAGHR